jgi:hypothetical protein
MNANVRPLSIERHQVVFELIELVAAGGFRMHCLQCGWHSQPCATKAQARELASIHTRVCVNGLFMEPTTGNFT